MHAKRSFSLFTIFSLLFAILLTIPISILFLQQRTSTQSKAAPANFVYREGNKLMLNGKPYQTASFNSFQLSGCGNAHQVPTDAQIDALFASLPDNIMIRTWAFAGNQAKIDRVVKAAEKHNIKLILTLADGRSHCGETDGASSPGNGKVPSWYTSGYKGKFMAHVTLMSTTYKNSPAIGMWEIINEPGNAEWPQIKSFLDAVAAEIKKNDPNHLISSGSWAEWAYGGEANFKSLHSGPNIDVGSLHEYDYDSSNGEIESNHFEETHRAMNQLNKPLIVGETGIEAGTGCKTNPQTRANAMKQKYDVYLNKGAVGVFAWNYAQAPDNCGHTFGPTDPIMEVIRTYPKNLEAAQAGSGGVTNVPTTAISNVPTLGQQSPAPTAGVTLPGQTTTLTFTVFLHGIGKGGDNVNPNAVGNLNPLNRQIGLTFGLFNAQNALVVAKVIPVTYNDAAGNYTGTTTVPNISSGSYTVVVRADKYLQRAIPGIQTITAGQAKQFASVALITGDIVIDNQVNILDYNTLMGCFSDLTPAKSCSAQQKTMSDLTNDGAVNQFDYSLFIRELTNIRGQ